VDGKEGDELMPPLLRAGFLAHARTQRYQRKVEQAKQRVSDWLGAARKPYIAFSTGKDSIVVLNMVREVAPNTPTVYFDADSCLPESLATLDMTDGLIRYATDEPILDTIARIGFNNPKALDRATMQSTVWGPIKRLIADYQFDGVALGLRADESRGRRLNAYTRGAIYQYKRDGVWCCQPIWDWRYNDVWAYIVSNNIDYCKAYDRLWELPEEDQRISYWAGETKRSHGRYSWLKVNYPHLFAKLIERIPEAGKYI
jgi:phosphoadenosine phosphosulfate reductase